jgi:antitoxin component YwqK of YwqJK toxin-antitoxin module
VVLKRQDHPPDENSDMQRSHLRGGLGYAAALGLLVAICSWDIRAAEEPKPILPELMGEFGTQPLKWKENWAADNTQNMTDAARLALKVATHPELSRSRLRDEIKAGGDRLKAAPRSLDVGRHDLVKLLFAKACERANAKLKADGLEPLGRATTVNSGGTGDFTRDVDVTVFGGDGVREQYLFEALLLEAEALHLRSEVDPKVGVKAGINFPQIEVALHRGNNDLPDPRFASDVHVFAADYRRVIEAQAKNPEAYFGYGFEVEVQGRRSLSFKPGQTLVQEFICEPGKPTQYRGQIASCQREVRAVLRGSIGQRYRRAQNASHIVNHYLQAFRHEQGSDHDLSKGALKYAGRSIEALCEYHGMKNWPDLVLADRLVVLKSLFPPGYGDTPNERQALEHMAQSLDVAYLTFVGKRVPEKAGGQTVEDPHHDSEMAIRFMQRAVAATAAAVAAEMIEPPAFDPKFLKEAAAGGGKNWDLMNAAERTQFALKADDNYKKCCSVAAMENLMCLVQQVRQLDLPEYNKKGTAPGKEALQQMLASANERTRPILELALDHAEAAVQLDTAKDPIKRKLAAEKLKGYRARLQQLTGVPAAGEEVLAKAEKISAKDYVESAKANKPSPLGQDMAELKSRFKEHLEEAFPPTDLAAFRAHLREVGAKSYLVNKMAHEIASPATALDLISLIEIYQNGGGKAELAKAAGISLVNRGHWALGFLIQAGEVKTEQDFKELEKNVAFDAFSRLIPGVGTLKIAFDIEKGLVNITVGYTINQLNNDLVDALYTGEAGRLNDGAAGKVAGQLRDSGFCILPDKYVVKETDEKTKQLSIIIQRPAMYVEYFRQFTGRDFDDRTTPIGERKAATLARHHDALVKALLDQTTTKEPGWFGESQAPGYVDPEGVSKAMAEYFKALDVFCRPIAQRILAESGVRQYIKDGRDVIEDGLVSRFSQDLLLGTISTWQALQLERVQAKREVESIANFADLNQIAGELRKSFESKPAKPEVKYGIEVRVAGASLDDTLDGSQPIPFRFVLTGNNDAPADAPDVQFDVELGKMSPPANGREYESNERVTQQYTVCAVTADGQKLAQTSFQARVVLPEKKSELKLLTYELKDDRSGKLMTRYTYYDAKTLKDPKNKPSVKYETEYGKCYHGKYSEYDSRGRLQEEITYFFGIKHGVRRYYEAGADNRWLSAETTFEMGKERFHVCYYPDGTKNWDMTYDDNQQMVAQTTYWGDGDKIMEKTTYRPVSGDAGRREGAYVAYWKDGSLRVQTEYRKVGAGVLVTRENIERYRHGPWLKNYKGGKPAERGQCANAVPVGTWDFTNEKGQPQAKIIYDDKGKSTEEERWEYWGNDQLKAHTHLRGGKKEGVWESHYENGQLQRKETYSQGVLNGLYAEGAEKGVLTLEGKYADGLKTGQWTSRQDDGTLSTETTFEQDKRNGPYASYHADGKPRQKGAFQDDLAAGPWAIRRSDGTLEETGAYANGRKEGLWVTYDAKGKRSFWEEYQKGDRIRSGDYKDEKK